MTTYRINEAHNGIEITFSSRPEADTLATLKQNGFRWHRSSGYWYTRNTETARAIAEAITNGTTEAPKTNSSEMPKKNRVDRAALTALYSQVWDSKKMIDYCVNKVATVATMPNGYIIPIDKQSIETRFCFGESGFDYEEAQEAAAHARTSADYLKRENMASFDRMVRDLEESKSGRNNYMVVIMDKIYLGQPDGCKLAGFRFERITDIIDACGGSAYIEELPGKELFVNGKYCRVATAEEIARILEAVKEARTAHEKKVDAYIKRYGTSKVHSWTYWREA